MTLQHPVNLTEIDLAQHAQTVHATTGDELAVVIAERPRDLFERNCVQVTFHGAVDVTGDLDGLVLFDTGGRALAAALTAHYAALDAQ